MTRRRFLSSLRNTVLALAAAPALCRLAEKVAVAVSEAAPVVTEMLNPAWVDAPYESTFVMHESAFKALLGKECPEHYIDPDPDRYECVDGEYVLVPKWKPVP